MVTDMFALWLIGALVAWLISATSDDAYDLSLAEKTACVLLWPATACVLLWLGLKQLWSRLTEPK